jgi:cytochrome c oxidase assembly factor CtaG
VNPFLDACLRSWPWDPWLLVGLVLSGAIYTRGWCFLRRRDQHRWHAGKLVAFVSGLSAIFLALASPIEPFAYFFLQVHMLQHLLLLMAAPALLWLGAPMFPLLRGLPQPIRVYWIAPLLRSPLVRGAFTRLTHPVAAWLVFVAATWFWHLPRFYDLALRSDGWHYVQHASFLASALVFWYPVVRPYPSRPGQSVWMLIPYLILADVQNTVLSALLTFSDRVLYSHYAEVPRFANLSALDDQAAAGVLMWVPGSVAFLVPLFVIGLGLLFGKKTEVRSQGSGIRGQVSGVRSQETKGTTRIALPLANSPSAPGSRLLTPDSRPLTPVPWLGRFLRWRHARLCLQLPLLVLAGFVIYDGFRGPQVGSMNLAGVLPWIHWRGLLILGLLILGNVFCMACPFTLPRTLARRWLPAGRAWPRWLRNKWLAVVLLISFLWAYEAFALWDSPWLTAWLALAYFAVAFVIDGLFQGASFCKYVCPIGQFNFVQSLISPLEIKTLDSNVCVACQTKECIRGGVDVPGCELHLYQPRKSSNMDCTFCLDCVHACPHENVGIVATPLGAELWRDTFRSGIGRWSKRRDLAALVVVLVFGAFANAALMTGPVMDWREKLADGLGLKSHLVATTLVFLIVMFVAPLLMVGGAAALCRWWGRLAQNWSEVAARYSLALVPLGFAMWLTHYSFHFLTSYGTVVPTAQRFVADLGSSSLLGEPEWSCACCLPTADWLLRLEIVFLDLGLLLSLYAAYRIARSQTERWPQALAAFAPWGILIFVLFAAGIWIVFQPMQMRGTM